MARKKNEVTLTFAGDSQKLESAFDNVGGAAKQMDDDVDTASRNTGEGFDRVGEAADDVDTKAMGFRDTLTGVQDTMGGAAEIAKGNLFQGFFQLGAGVGDLASGMFNLLIPSLKKGVTWLKSTTVAQRALNIAMRLNPIGIIITLLVALGAALIVAWKKSKTFRRIVKGAWEGIKTAASATWDFLKGVFNWLKDLPGKLGSAFSTLADIITSPFRTAFDAIKSLWNSTAGGFGFDTPSWIPGIGGKSFRIPKMHRGGIVPGAPGQEQLMLMQAGERVTPAVGASGGRTVLELRSSGTALDDALVEILARAVQARGGDVQLVIGSA